MCGPSTPEDKQDHKANQQLAKAAAQEKKVQKLLLLGAGESGKSTLFKQVKIIHQEGFSDAEREEFIPVLHFNLVENSHALIRGAIRYELEPKSQEVKMAVDAVLRLASDQPLTTTDFQNMAVMWNDKVYKKIFKNRAKLQINDSAEYYFDALDRISKPDFLPTDQDILQSRVRTTGVVATEFKVKGVQFRLIDVGGQRNERRKWIHQFDMVNAVLFVVAISEYDQKLYEDNETNRLHEALNLFRQINNSTFFKNTAMIMFYNKDDLFREKVKRVDLSVCFDDYKGGLDYDAALKHIKRKFAKANENPDKAIYEHVTCATDTRTVTAVFEAVQDIVLRANLNRTFFDD